MERAYGVAPTNAPVSMSLAYALARFDRFEEALVILGDWHALDPENALPFSVAGDLFFQSRQLDLALKSYYQAFRMVPYRADGEIDGLVWLFIDGLSMPSSELVLHWAKRRISNIPASTLGHMQKIVFTARSGRRAEAARLIDELAQQHPEWPVTQARLRLIFDRDYGRSREFWEAAGVSEQPLELWPTLLVLEYAFLLQQTGDPDRARTIIDATPARIEEQMAAGVRNVDLWELNFYAGMMHAIRGENEKAIDYLRRNATNRGLSTLEALISWPEFDGLRDFPEFQALIDEQHEHNARWRQRLEEEGLLLTPEKVLALADFDFDPFKGSE